MCQKVTTNVSASFAHLLMSKYCFVSGFRGKGTGREDLYTNRSHMLARVECERPGHVLVMWGVIPMS